MKSKTMILQSQTADKNGRAILTVSKQDDLLTTKIRLYAFPPLSADTKLGIYHHNQVYAANMLFKGGAYLSSLVGEFDLDDDFYCAVVDTANNNTPILAGGTYGGFYFNDTSIITDNLDNSFSEKATQTTVPQQSEKNIQFAQPIEDFATSGCSTDCTKAADLKIANESTKFGSAQDENPCAKCKYKAYFYGESLPPDDALGNNPIKNASSMADLTTKPANSMPQSAAQTSVFQAEQPPQPNEGKFASLAESLIPQFEYIFKTYPECEELNSRISNSRFVTITELGSTYCLGAIYKQDEIEYICYALPAAYNAPVPEELGQYHQWLPLDPDDPLSDGYHIVYQDAHDLKIIEV